MRALGRLKNLEELDGIPVSNEELTTALKMAAASRISSFAVLAHSRTDQVRPRTLSLVSTAHIILTTSFKKPVRPMDEDSQWFVKVTMSVFTVPRATFIKDQKDNKHNKENNTSTITY